MAISKAIYPNLYEIDHIIQEKFEALLTNGDINEKYLDFKRLDVLDEPLVCVTDEAYDFNEISHDSLVEALNLLKKENADLIYLFNQVNKERKTLKIQNYKLMERLFAFENFEIEKFDQDFNRFLSKAVFMNYELCKNFLEKERDNNETMKKMLQIKDDEVVSLKNKITMLEQRVIESRKMLKKSILDTAVSPSHLNRQNTATTVESAKTPKDLLYAQQLDLKDTPPKLSSPSSVQDTTADSLNKPSNLDLNRNINNLQRKDLSQMVGQNQLEASISGLNFEKFSANLAALEDNFLDEMEANPHRSSGRSSAAGGTNKGSSSPIKNMKEEQKEVKSFNKVASAKSRIPAPLSIKSTQKESIKPPTQISQTPSGRATTFKKDFPTQKSIDLAAKGSKNKTEESIGKVDNENLTLSFLLDQNVSVDGINQPSMMVTSAAAKELENELKRRGVGNGSKLDSSGFSQKKAGSISSTNKISGDASKIKPKVNINSSPIPVKKKTTTEPK